MGKGSPTRDTRKEKGSGKAAKTPRANDKRKLGESSQDSSTCTSSSRGVTPSIKQVVVSTPKSPKVVESLPAAVRTQQVVSSSTTSSTTTTDSASVEKSDAAVRQENSRNRDTVLEQPPQSNRTLKESKPGQQPPYTERQKHKKKKKIQSEVVTVASKVPVLVNAKASVDREGKKKAAMAAKPAAVEGALSDNKTMTKDRHKTPTTVAPAQPAAVVPVVVQGRSRQSAASVKSAKSQSSDGSKSVGHGQSKWPGRVKTLLTAGSYALVYALGYLTALPKRTLPKK